MHSTPLIYWQGVPAQAEPHYLTKISEHVLPELPLGSSLALAGPSFQSDQRIRLVSQKEGNSRGMHPQEVFDS